MRTFAVSLRALARSDVLRATIAISLRRATGQAAILVSTIVCTRFYAPADFGTAGVVFSAASIVAILCSLRLETHALRARRRDVRQAYVGLAYGASIAAAVAGSIILLAVALLRGGAAWQYLSVPAAGFLLSLTQYLLPAQLPETGNARRIGRMSQVVSGTTAVAQIVLAVMLPTAAGLIAARLVGMLAGLVGMGQLVRQGVAAAIGSRRRDARRLWRPAVREFVFGSPASIVSLIGFQAPIYLFALLDQQAAAGVYWFAFSLIFVPYFIVASSLRPLLLRSISGKRLPSEQWVILRDLTIAAAILAVVAMVGIVAGAQLIVKFALSAKWQLASPYAGWLGLLVAGVIVQTPISAVLPVLRQQQANLVYNVIQLVLRAVALVMATYWSGSSVSGIAAFSICGFTLSILYCFWTFMNVAPRLRPGTGPT